MFNLVWYRNLVRPPLTPPSWVFSPAWILLYSLIFASLLIYTLKCTRKNKMQGYIYFVAQMIFNILWSPAFFVFHNIGLALIIIVILDVLVCLNIKYFFKVSKISAILLIPYLLWTVYATYLNLGFYLLNK